MKSKDIGELLLLAGLWGASFLFLRVAAPAFGPFALIFVRVGVAGLCLLPILIWRGELRALRQAWWPLTVVGLLNSALPFCCFAFATLSLSAGFTAVLNATSPLWGAMVAFVWLGIPLPRWRIIGLALGFCGVTLLVWGRISFKAGGSGLGILAALLATFCYGIAANYTKEKLKNVSPLAVATGSQVAATIMLTPFALVYWPQGPLPGAAWQAAFASGVFCTAIAYLMYFRLIARLGASRAISVTFLIPLFAILWGGLFLSESLTLRMVVGGAVILLGTSLAVGVWVPKLRVRAASS